jgi:hypothetical protein
LVCCQKDAYFISGRREVGKPLSLWKENSKGWSGPMRERRCFEVRDKVKLEAEGESQTLTLALLINNAN